MLRDRRRIMVIGSGGAGKSTFARELAELRGLPLVHLDLHYWGPRWTPPSEEDWAERVRKLCSTLDHRRQLQRNAVDSHRTL
jgi:adenylate kinase family enzyme